MENHDAVSYLKEKIKTYERKLSEINAQIAALESESNRLQGLIRSASTLLKEELRSSQQTFDFSEPERLAEKLRTLSVSDAIEEIVYRNRGPIHADQILKQLKEAGITFTAKKPKNSIVSLLHRGVKSGIFEKVGPNLFAPTRHTQAASSS